MIKRCLFFSIAFVAYFLFANPFQLLAQCPVPAFTAPDTVCANQPFNITNTTIGATQYTWDMCAGDLNKTPTAVNLGSLGISTNGINRLAMVKESGAYFMFLTDFANSQVYRLEFGNNLDNIPTAVLINTSGIGAPGGIDFIKESGLWYALVTDVATNSLFKLQFITGISDASPTVTNIGNASGLDIPLSVRITKDGNSIHAFSANLNTNSISRTDFGNSINNTPTGQNLGAVPGVSSAYDFQVAKFCNQWVGFLPGLFTGKIIRVDFGANITNSPVYVDLGNFGLTAASGISLAQDAEETHLFYGEYNFNTFHRLSFGPTISTPPTLTNFGNIGAINQPRGVLHYSDSSKHRVFITNYNDKTITRISFPDSCSSNQPITNITSPAGLIYSNPGNKVISLTSLDATGNYAGARKNIFVKPSKPITSFTQSSLNVCFYDTVFFNDQSVSTCFPIVDWLWSFGDNTFSNAQNANHNYLPGIYTAKLITTNSIGEKDSLSKVINVRGAKASFSVIDGCVSDSLNFLNTSIFQITSSVNWTWQFGDGQSSILKNPKHFYNADGNYSVSLKAVSDGCTDSTSQAVQFFLSPNAAFSVTKTCSGDTTNFINITSPAPPGIGYMWDFGDASSSSVPNPSHAYAAGSASYPVTLIATSINGCNDTITQNVSITNPASPSFTFTPPQPCQGSALSFTDLSTLNGDSITSWHWLFSATDSSNVQSPSYTFTQAGTFAVTLTVTTGSQCKTTVTQNISTAPRPIANFNATNVCFGNSTDFTDLSTPPISPPGTLVNSWLWNFGDSTTDTVQNPSHFFAAPGVYIVTLTIGTNNTGCTHVFTKQVTVNSFPSAGFTRANACNGQFTQFNDTTTVLNSAISAWSWNFGDPGTGAANISMLKNPTHLYAQSGTYIVKLVTTSAAGCMDSTTVPISVKRTPASIFSATSACDGEFVSFTSVDTIFPSNASQWFWNFGNGGTSILQNPATLYLNYGTFNVTLTVTDTISGCAGILTQPVTVNPNPTAAINLFTPCAGIPFALQQNSAVPVGFIQSWQWIINNTDTLTGASPFYTFPDTGSANIRLMVTSDKGCKANTSRTIQISGSPQASFSFTPLFGDAPLQVTFINSSLLAATYTWQFGDGATSVIKNPVHIYGDTGVFNISLIAYNASGCPDTASGSIYIIPPIIDLAVTKLYSTNTGNYLSLSADLTNFGTRDIHSFEIIAQAENKTLIKESWFGLLKSGQSINYLFNAAIESPPNNFKFYCIKTFFPNGELDSRPVNDQLCASLLGDFQIISVFPNPFSSEFSVEFSLPLAGWVTYQIINVNGSQVIDATFEGNKGYNKLMIDTEKASMSNGSYILKISFGDTTVFHKLAKY